MAKQKKQAVLDIPVSFNGVSIGDGTANIGVKIDRKHLDIMAADESLCGRRLSGRVIVIQNGDDPKQKMIAADMKHELASTFDTKSFRVSPKYITTGLTFALGEIDIAQLGFFAKQSGQLIVNSIEELETSTEAEADGDEEAEDPRRHRVHRDRDRQRRCWWASAPTSTAPVPVRRPDAPACASWVRLTIAWASNASRGQDAGISATPRR